MLLKKSKIICTLLGASLLALPIIASAALTIVNNTSHDSTTIINNTCSTAIGSDGITHPHSVNQVSDMNIRLVCFMTPNNCVADVRMTADCSGESVATVVYDVDSGVKQATLTPAGALAGYRLSHSGNAIQFDGN
ncbi:MAG: hypothetical protein P4M12_07005 [Gammaproteobacteria bacterium]|nr:hypothetical protein [Gammaproteobacteria bacterium]